MPECIGDHIIRRDELIGIVTERYDDSLQILWNKMKNFQTIDMQACYNDGVRRVTDAI